MDEDVEVSDIRGEKEVVSDFKQGSFSTMVYQNQDWNVSYMSLTERWCFSWEVTTRFSILDRKGTLRLA